MKWCGNDSEERVSNNDRNDFKPMLMRTKMMLTVDSDFDACSPQQHLCLVGNKIPQGSRRCTAGFPHRSCHTSILKKTGFTHSVFIGSIFLEKKVLALPVQIKTDRSKSSSSQHQKEEKSRRGCGQM